MSSGLEDSSLFDLFRMEAEEQVRVLQSELLRVESGEATAVSLEALMRASHSLKGAARIVGLDVIVTLTHAMEDRFVAAQQGQALDSADVDRMLAATDWLGKLQSLAEAETAPWLAENAPAIHACAAAFHVPGETAQPAPESTSLTQQNPQSPVASAPDSTSETPAPPPVRAVTPAAAASTAESRPAPPERDIFSQQDREERSARERNVRLTADQFDQMLSLSAETLVSARQLASWGSVLDRNHRAIGRSLQMLQESGESPHVLPAVRGELERQVAMLATQIADLDQVSRANERIAERLHRAVLAGRLRPFSEGITGISRLVRDTARELGKSVKLEVHGETTRVDRDILDRLEAPLSHLVNNAIDHGIEAPAARSSAGKPAEARLLLHARHENGRLVITVRDDGHGIDIEQIRNRVIRRNLAPADTVAGLCEAELLEFLFLPGFSTRETTSVISGRGVGLNVVQSMVQEAGGSVTVSSNPGAGTAFRLTLPVTRSVIRAIRVLAEGELYSIPMVRVDHVAQLEPEGDPEAPQVRWNDRLHPVIVLASMLGLSNQPLPKGPVPLLFSGGFAFAVDRFVDQAELSVRRLDPRLGKIPGVSAASLDENGLPLLILDMDDLIQTAAGTPASTTSASLKDSLAPHILVVDDSHTVREMERRLLVRSGYTVSAAQNGQEAWNLLRLNDYDLLISDVDMPQMNGIELVTRVRGNPRLARIPVIILSYKDREEDRRRGLEAGADFYLTKGAFDNGSFLQAVVDLIGEAAPVPSGDPS
ncbi:MAG TPA: response regulator [Terracidiphilus sp.]|jgi:two-component system sensor histidine kinase and response regulator WspE|nr:response regulator [Terracidiphilus sp.]